jgi:hypothetical protein
VISGKPLVPEMLDITDFTVVTFHMKTYTIAYEENVPIM